MNPWWAVAAVAGWVAVSVAAAPLVARWLSEQLPVDLEPPTPSDDDIRAHVEELLAEIRRETA